MSGRSLRSGAAIAAAALTFLLVGCQPMPHTTQTVRAPATDPATTSLISGDGRYVVVVSTGSGAVTPSAGNWRITRADETARPLPAGTPLRISTDGQRVLIGTGSGTTLWNAGTSTQASGSYSSDLTARAFVGTDGTVQVQTVATGVVRSAETGHPRPTGTTPTRISVSDDGNVVQLAFSSAGVTTVRTIDLATGTASDATDASGSAADGSYIDESYRLAPSGRTIVVTHERMWSNEFGSDVFEAWVEQRRTTDGSVVVHHDLATTNNEMISAVVPNDRGDIVWVVTERRPTAGPGGVPRRPCRCSASCPRT